MTFDIGEALFVYEGIVYDEKNSGVPPHVRPNYLYCVDMVCRCDGSEDDDEVLNATLLNGLDVASWIVCRAAQWSMS